MIATTVSPAKFESIPLATLDIAAQVRTTMDKQALQELADDMRTNGVLQPILVRPLGKGKFRVIAGHRRAAAAAIAELTHVPAIVKDADEEQALMMQLSENLHREDLSDIDTANAVRRLFDHFGTLAAVAAFTMKSKSWVSKHLSITLPNFSYDAKRMIEDGVTEDLEIVGLANQVWLATDYNHRQPMADFIAGVKGGWNRDQCREFVKTLKDQIKNKAELDSAKAKIAAAKTTTKKPPKFKPKDVLTRIYYSGHTDDLGEYTKEQQAEMLELLKPLHTQGCADRESATPSHKGQSVTANLWPLVINACSAARGWEFAAYTGGLLGAELSSLAGFLDRAFSFQTDGLLTPTLHAQTDAPKTK